jgi:2-C-methyl-D-erythritol 2,4-cyclodiphosphate synthase
LVKEKGYILGNIDATVVAEKPKINPHIPQMQAIIAEILETAIDNISLKATTNEKMDAPGREESMLVHAVALIVKK